MQPTSVFPRGDSHEKASALVVFNHDYAILPLCVRTEALTVLQIFIVSFRGM